MSNAGKTFPLFLACVLAAPGALADRVQVPLTLDSHFIQMLLEREVFSNADGSPAGGLA